MSFRSSMVVGFRKLGMVTVGLIAFALIALQGCAAPTVTASSLREPGAPVVGLGRLRADEPTRTTTVERPERVVVRSSQSREHGFRSYNSCRRCAP